MASIIIMPKQGLQMTEGYVTKWLVEEGGKVEKGTPLFDMETDKLNITMDAAEGGTLLKILHDAGDVVPITEAIAIIGEPGEDISELLAKYSAAEDKPKSFAEPVSTLVISAVSAQDKETNQGKATIENKVMLEGPAYASPRAKSTAEEKRLDFKQVVGSGPEGLIIEKDVLDYFQAIPKATPLARTIASQEGASLKDISGTGASGKITAADVQSILTSRQGEKTAPGSRGETKVPMTTMRKVVAGRMKQSLSEMAQANHRMDIDMTEAVKLREQLKSASIKVSYNDIILRCVAKALTEFPMMNASMLEDGFVLKQYVNLGMAVAVEGGLIVPVIDDADLMTLQEIAIVSADLAAKAKDKRLQPAEFSGGTFTVSNLGMFDVTSFTAIVNPPEVGIIGVGMLEKRAVVIGDQIVIRPMMTLSLTYDHRVVDGAPAAEFLRRVKKLLQTPALLL